MPEGFLAILCRLPLLKGINLFLLLPFGFFRLAFELFLVPNAPGVTVIRTRHSLTPLLGAPISAHVHHRLRLSGVSYAKHSSSHLQRMCTCEHGRYLATSSLQGRNATREICNLRPRRSEKAKQSGRQIKMQITKVDKQNKNGWTNEQKNGHGRKKEQVVERINLGQIRSETPATGTKQNKKTKKQKNKKTGKVVHLRDESASGNLVLIQLWLCLLHFATTAATARRSLGFCGRRFLVDSTLH
jgi:hypothetical protein